MNKRLIKKINALIAVIAVLVNMLAVFNCNSAYAAVNDDDYINDNYATVVSESGLNIKMYGGSLFTTNSHIGGIQGSSYSYADKTNLGEQIDLNTDSVLTYVDKYGNINKISNVNDDGTSKYDSIYGSPTRGYYNYIITKKNNKLSIIDTNGERVTLGDSESYDDILFYNTIKNEHYYGLKTKISEKVFKYQLVKEDGTIIYTLDRCSRNYEFEKKYQDICIMLKTEDGINILIDFAGNILSQNSDAIKDCRIGDLNPWIILQYESSYVYYNYENGFIKEGNGLVKYQELDWDNNNSYISVDNDNGHEIYDAYMNMIVTIPAQYKNFRIDFYKKDISRITAYTTGRWDSNTKIMIYNGDGSKRFDKDMNSESKRVNCESGIGGVYSDDNGINYYIDCYGEKILYSDMKNYAETACNDYIGNTAKIKNVDEYITTFGYIFKYELNNNNECVVILKRADDYKRAEIIEANGFEIYNDTMYEYINNNKTIITNEDKEIKCEYELNNIYMLDSEKIEKYSPEIKLYCEWKSSGSYGQNCYKEDGQSYNVKENNIEKKANIPNEKEEQYNIGNKGYYINVLYEYDESVSSNNKYIVKNFELIGPDNTKVDTIIDDLRSDNNVSGIKLQFVFESGNYQDKLELSDHGYFGIRYYKNSKSYIVILKYDGEVILDCSDSSIKNNFVYINGNIIKLKNLVFNSIDDVIGGNLLYKVNKIDGINEKIFFGINSDSKVKEIVDNMADAEIRIVNSNGRDIGEDEYVGTGCVIQLMDGNNVSDSAIVMIKGDTDGTGTIDVLDMETIQKSILGIGDSLSGVYKEAALLNGDDTDEVTVLDMEAIQKDILGIEKIN